MHPVRVYVEGERGYQLWPESQVQDRGFQYDVRFGGFIRKWDVKDTYDPFFFTLMGMDDPLYQAGHRMRDMIEFFTNKYKFLMSWRAHKHYLVKIYLPWSQDEFYKVQVCTRSTGRVEESRRISL